MEFLLWSAEGQARVRGMFSGGAEGAWKACVPLPDLHLYAGEYCLSLSRGKGGQVQWARDRWQAREVSTGSEQPARQAGGQAGPGMRSARGIVGPAGTGSLSHFLPLSIGQPIKT